MLQQRDQQIFSTCTINIVFNPWILSNYDGKFSQMIRANHILRERSFEYIKVTERGTTFAYQNSELALLNFGIV